MNEKVSPRARLLADAMLASLFGVNVREVGWQARLLQGLESAYREGDNPVTVFFALDFIAKNELTIPTWVSDYLSAGVQNIHSVALRNKKGKNGQAAGKGSGAKKGNETEEIGRALGFGPRKRGGTSAAKEAQEIQRNLVLAVHVALQMGLDEERGRASKLDGIAAFVAEHQGCSASTVKRAYTAYGDHAQLALQAAMDVGAPADGRWRARSRVGPLVKTEAFGPARTMC